MSTDQLILLLVLGVCKTTIKSISAGLRFLVVKLPNKWTREIGIESSSACNTLCALAQRFLRYVDLRSLLGGFSALLVLGVFLLL